MMERTLPKRVSKDAIVSRNEIESMIADGRKIIIVDGKVLKVDAWLPYHPGGDKAIMHMVGRDATDEVTALHSAEAKQRMFSFQIGRIEGSRWKSFVPPIQGGVFRKDAGQRSVHDIKEDMERSQASSSESSTESSPIFEPADRSSRMRRRQPHDSSSTRESSASSVTSVSSSELDKPKAAPKMSHLDVRTQEEIRLDLDKYPPLDPNIQADIVQKYRLLNERIKAEGLYRCPYTSYAIEGIRYALLFSLSLLFLSWRWYALSGFCMGAVWHQLVFTAHDSGHMGITHDFHTDTVIGIIIADYIGGLSLGWWKRNHNVHHIVTNSAEHDPDIQHMPFFAISHQFFNSLRSTYYNRVMTYDPAAKVLIRFQHYLYYPILLFGRFNLYVLSWSYLLSKDAPRKGPAWWHRYFEMAGQVFFWTWFGYFLLYRGIDNNWGRFVFVMVSHMTTMPLHVQITLSHFAMSTADLGVHESFPQRMLRTTMDVDCPQWLDFFHGGLQFQVIHHLYPRIPRHNLRRTQKLVQAFCDEVGIPYALFGFVEGNKEVISRLGDVARQAKILAECQRTLAESGDYGLH